jgi:hypothetical protein
MQVGNTNGFDEAHMRKWWQATRDYLFADLESLPESAAHIKPGMDVQERN